MRGYIITMSVAAIICSVLEIFAPKQWEKYVKLALGLVIMSIILSPVMAMKKEKIELAEESFHERGDEFYHNVATELKARVEQDIEERLLKEFKLEAKATVDIDVDENHNIKGVNAIWIKCRKNPPKLRERLEEIYGCERIEINSK